jgi:nicotinamide-nucleotide amidase
MIGQLLTAMPGSSKVFKGGSIVYSNEEKERQLGVVHDTLVAHGAVSEQAVREMAEGARTRFGVDMAVSVSGIAGPDGGTPDKPVGTVWIGWKRRGGYAQSELFHFDGDREAVRRQTVAAALRGVQRILTS